MSSADIEKSFSENMDYSIYDSEIFEIKKFLEKLSKEQIQDLINDEFDFSDYDIVEDYPDIYNTPLEIFISILSTIHENSFYDGLKIPELNNLYLTMLYESNFPMEKESIILERYKPNSEFFVYNDDNTVPEDVKHFMSKYSFVPTFGFKIDFKLAKINFEMKNIYTFLQFENFENPSGYEVKHFMISQFYKVWNIYTSEIMSSEKELFFEEIIKKHFCSINWRTMSRLYNPDDSEFMEKFSSYLYMEFAKQYHPKFK